MKREYEEAFAEIDEIIQLMPIKLSIKIPLQFKKIISENKAEYYKPNIKEPIDEKQLKYETKVILGLIYRDFLVSPEEREELQARDSEELRKVELEMQENYDMADFRSKREQNNDLILYNKISIFKKIGYFIKGFFTKKKVDK